MPFSLCKSMKCTLSLCNLFPTRPSLEEEFAAFSLKKRFCMNFFLLFWHFFFFFFLFKHTVLIVILFHRRLARLVVGPFCAWNCTGGGPSVHWKITNSMKILQPLPGEGRNGGEARGRSSPCRHSLPPDEIFNYLKKLRIRFDFVLCAWSSRPVQFLWNCSHSTCPSFQT